MKYDCKLIYYIFIFLILLILLNYSTYGSEIPRLNITRNTPLDVNLKINANYGQFRSKTDAYKIHDGIDYRAVIGTPVYPIAPGTAHIHPADDYKASSLSFEGRLDF